MAGTTPELSLPTAQDSDDLEQYLTLNPGGLVAALTALDALFNATTGHAHDGAHKGKPITTAGIADLGITRAKIAAEAFTSFSPTLTQGVALTLSSAVGFYQQVGKRVDFSVDITVNSAGTSGQAVVLGGLPVAAQTRGSSGVGWYARSGVNFNGGLTGVWQSTTSIKFYAGVGVADVFGANPAFASGVGDQLHLSGWYEAA